MHTWTSWLKKTPDPHWLCFEQGWGLDPEDLQRSFLTFVIPRFCDSIVFHCRVLSLNVKQLVVNIIFHEKMIRGVSWVQDRNSSSKPEKEADLGAWWLGCNEGDLEGNRLPRSLTQSRSPGPWAISSAEVGLLKIRFFMKKFHKVSFSYSKISNVFTMGRSCFLASSPTWLRILQVPADLTWLLTSAVTKLMTIFLCNFNISDGLTPLF